MKVRIEFTTNEKVAINACDIHENDYSVKSEGNFGTAEYNREENFFEFNLKETFIAATANLIASFANMVKGFVSTANIFEASWLSDIKTKRLDNKDQDETDESNKESDDCSDH